MTRESRYLATLTFLVAAISAYFCVIFILTIHAGDTSPSVCEAPNVTPSGSLANLALSYDLYGPGDLYKNLSNSLVDTVSEECFIAAVHEHVRVDFPKDFQRAIDSNLEAYENSARTARENGAHIWVGPEDGIVYGSRSSMRPWLEIVPDPMELVPENNNPCTHFEIYRDSPILMRLSCIARKYRLYIVANYGTKQPCKKSDNQVKLADPREEAQAIISDKCPKDNAFLYNTDVIFGNDGTFLAKYRKVNMFIEPFDRAPSPDAVVLPTVFGNLGIITCFDMMFKTPAVDLVEDHYVDTIIFPTWWFDTLPTLSAIQFQDAWSRRLNVNLLAANIHAARKGSLGSGIYSGSGGAQIYIGSNNNRSQVMLAALPKRAGKKRSYEEQELASARCRAQYEPRMYAITSTDSKPDGDAYRYTNTVIDPNDIIIPMTKVSDTVTKCIDDFCCRLTYTVSAKDEANLDRLVLMVRNGLRPGQFRWWEQICTVATLDSTNKLVTLDASAYQFARNGFFKFEHLQMNANFSTNYVYPIMAHDISTLVQNTQRHGECHQDSAGHNQCSLSYQNRDDVAPNEILVASLYGRLYEKDAMYWELER